MDGGEDGETGIWVEKWMGEDMERDGEKAR